MNTPKGNTNTEIILNRHLTLHSLQGVHGSTVVAYSSHTAEMGDPIPAGPQVGKLVVVCHWSAVNSTEP